MDAFEQVVSEILWHEGYWVRTAVKVGLTKEEKVKIGRPSSPRWELDIVAYHAATNTLRVVECKSYMDSLGVQLSALTDSQTKAAKRYKLFHDNTLKEVVMGRLVEQFTENGACQPNPTLSLGLACGKIARESEREAIKLHFVINNWELLDEHWLREKLEKLAKGNYENQVSAIVAKLLTRTRG
jgi:hypothetical protein